jgi:hypothetical protein
MLDLKTLSTEDRRLIQAGLKYLDFYTGSTKGLGGPITDAAYKAYFDSLKVTADPPTAHIDLIASLVAILKAEEGVREVPANSNRGDRVQQYQAATWLTGSGWPWCAAFICWGIRELEKVQLLPFKRPQTAGAWDFENWAKSQGVKRFKPRQKIKAGDIVIFTFSHIGLAIEDEKGGVVRTVEGNTDLSGSREGGGVYIKARPVSSIRSHIRLELA